MTLLIFGLKSRNFGPHWNLCLLVVILLDRCLFRLNSSKVLIKTG